MKNVFYIFILVAGLSSVLFAQNKLIFVIRVDDIMNRSMTILPRSIMPFENVVEKYGGKITWLVIPHRLIEDANKDGKLKNELKESVLKGNEVAQHGYNHICQLCNKANHEMYCTTYNHHFSYDEQKNLVLEGKKILEDSLGVTPVTFVSPGHHEDTTTYHVLRDEGFKWISTTQPTKTFLYPNLFNLAAQNEFTWALTSANYNSQLNNALNDIKTKGQADGYYCILFHDYFIRAGYQDSLVLHWTNALLDSVVNRYGSNLEFMTIAEAAQYFENKITSTEKNRKHSISYSLEQNYPNPFNPSTKISYSLPYTGNVKIEVFNLLGQKVRELVNTVLKAGNHSVNFNADELASGVYFYSVTVNAVDGKSSFRDVKKMLLQK